jgi:uncharacterized protein YuzE
MKDTDFIERARGRFSEAREADQDNRERALDDLQNLIGDGQWPANVREQREADERPCLTINRLPQFVRQVTGDIRRMNPAIKVTPGDTNASDDVSEVIEGLIRQIQYKSDASSVYESAGESAAQCGMGYLRVRADWESDDSFDQEILIERVDNPFAVYFDPAAKDPTRKDAGYVFVTEAMSIDDFEEAHPKATAVDIESDSEVDGIEDWRDGASVIVAEYIYREAEEKTIGLLQDGTVVEDPVAPLPIVRTRKVQVEKIMWAKITGKEVLEGPTELPGKHMPIIAVMGEEICIGKEVRRSSVIRYAKDPQRLYNYWRSAQTELVALQPKAPYLVTPKQVAGFEGMWRSANNSNEPYLVYNPDEKAPGRPERAQPPIASSGMMQEVMTAAEDMKGTTGIYDAGLGSQGNEKSGIAIQRRQTESDISTSIYSDNMAKAIGQCGRVIVSMIPRIYDTRRVVQILGKDDNPQEVTVNDVIRSQDGIQRVNELRIGKYDVRVSVGPNYTTKRQETAESMIDFVRAFPPAGQVAADLVAKNMDWPGAEDFAERLKKLIPPGIVEDDEPPTPEEQAQMQQQQQLQQAQMQMTMQGAQIELQQSAAEAKEAEADAEKARLEVAEKSLELAVKNGQLDAVINQAVARALQSAMGQYAPQQAQRGPF